MLRFIRYRLVIMAKPDKALLRKQADVYIAWGRRNDKVPYSYDGWIQLFINTLAKTDIMDVDEKDIEKFLSGPAFQVSRMPSERITSRKAVEGFKNYYEARTKNGKNRRQVGRPAHLSEIERVKLYRKMGLKYKEIERLTGKKISILHRWIHYKLDE